METMKVFLGGTTNKSTWRDKLIPMLKCDYFNPVVDEWTEDCFAKEMEEKYSCNYHLYVITKEMKGIYSITEAINDSNKIPNRTLFCILEDGFDKDVLKSLLKTSTIIQANGGYVFNSLEAVADFLNFAYYDNKYNS